MSAEGVRLGVRISTDQLPILLDVLRIHPVDVCITDTSDTAVLDASWRPWARRSKPWLQASMGEVYFLAPMYTFPDPQHHARQRQIIAEQLQHVIEAAVYCEARGIILPIESLMTPYRERLRHYLDVVVTLLATHEIRLVLATSAYCTAAEIAAFAAEYDPPLPIASPHSDSSEQHIWLDTTDQLPDAFVTCTHTATLWAPANQDSTIIREHINTWGTPAVMASDEASTDSSASDDVSSQSDADESDESASDNARSS